MKRVTIIPSYQMTLFGPRITIFTKDGKSYTKQGTGREFMWDFNEEVRRIREVIPGLPIPAPQFEEIIATCRGLDTQARADTLGAAHADKIVERTERTEGTEITVVPQRRGETEPLFLRVSVYYRVLRQLRSPGALHASEKRSLILDFFSRRPVRDTGCACGRRC